ELGRYLFVHFFLFLLVLCIVFFPCANGVVLAYSCRKPNERNCIYRAKKHTQHQPKVVLYLKYCKERRMEEEVCGKRYCQRRKDNSRDRDSKHYLSYALYLLDKVVQQVQDALSR